MKTKQDYIEMQREYYDDTSKTPEFIVGNIGWHSQLPYEKLLLNGRTDTITKTALDFGCGPGIMLSRMRPFFKRVDGVDISPNLLRVAKERFPDSDFYPTNGNDAGNAPENHYDFVYSTLCFQHIASRSIRKDILRSLATKLAPSGTITIQMGYVDKLIGPHHKSWDTDAFEAGTTNSGCDVAIELNTLPMVEEDFGQEFSNIKFTMFEVRSLYGNLNGHTHPVYWPSHWIFIHGEKK